MTLFFACSIAKPYFFTIKDGIPVVSDSKNQMLSAEFSDQNLTEQHFSLIINASESVSEVDQSYLGGYAEGYLTGDLIAMHYSNIVKAKYSEKHIDYAKTQIQHIKTQYQSNNNSPLFKAAFLIIKQLDGLQLGFSKSPRTIHQDLFLSVEELFLFNSQCDFYELEYFFNATQVYKNRKDELVDRCTGALRLTDNLNLFMGHNTWLDYYITSLRITKTYIFHFQLNDVIRQQLSFSSSPGYLLSMEDMYVVKNTDKSKNVHDLGVLETSLVANNEAVLNDTVDHVGNASVITWIRMMAANYAATSRGSWVEIFDQSHSYTFNNNYLLVDYSEFAESRKSCADVPCLVKQNASFVSLYEVVPGSSKSLDVSDSLLANQGFALFNLPYFEEHRVILAENVSFDQAPRFKIAARDLPKIQNIEEFKTFMRSNDYLNDEFADKNPRNAIAARKDLIDKLLTGQDPMPAGAMDAKVVDQNLIGENKFWFVLGPSTASNTLPAFDFSSWPNRTVPEGAWKVFPETWSQLKMCGRGYLGDCQSCGKNTKVVGGICEEFSNNQAAVLCSIIIPSVLIAVGLIVWSVLFKKQQLKKDTPLLEEVENQEEEA